MVTRVAAAKSLQSCPTQRDPIDCSPPGSPVPGILQARTLGEDKPPWQGFGKAHCNTVCNVLHSIRHTKVSLSSSSSNPSSWAGPGPPAGLSLRRNLLTWHQKSLSSTLSSVISLPSHPSLSFFICKMGPINFVWKCIMGLKQGASWKRAWGSRGLWKMLVSIVSFSVDPK